MLNYSEEPLILVVDDTLTNLEVISEALSDAGFEVATALDGERALKQIQYSPPDLILLDVMMPGLDGFETCKLLKDNPQTSDIPVIFMTAVSDAESKVKAFNLGAVDYITKPFQEEEVLARVNTHLKLRSLTKKLEYKVAERTTALTTALQQLQQFQVQLIQNEKMSALGNLVAGVAHEINNPVGCIMGNLTPAREYIEDLLRLVELYQKYYPQPIDEIEEEIEAMDLEYIREDLPKIILSMKAGIERISHISNSLRIFSRADCDRPIACDIHETLDSTLLILKYRIKANEYRPEIQVIRDYQELPLIMGFPGQLNQVFMNIIANAIDALEDSSVGFSFADLEKRPNKIIISTEILADKPFVEIRIQDNGPGMSEAVQSRIFEHLFTTKPVGKGTGLGLSIARQIIEEKHGGQISCTSVPEKGTQFLIRLPL